MSGLRRSSELEWVWLVPVVLAAVICCATVAAPAVAVPLLAVALLPWALGIIGRPPPSAVFALLGIGPVVVLLALEGLSSAVFLGTTTLSLLAGRAVRRRDLVLLSAVGVALPFTAVLAGQEFDPGAFYFAIGDLFGIALGRLLGRARRLGEELRAADARLAALAAQEERTRLARDVHDLVAHSLTVVVLQVGGARRVLRSDPAAAEDALTQAERVCRDSLDGIREVVGLLRADDAAPGSPLDLAPLADTYRAAAVPVELAVEGDLEGQPLLVRGTLYRVVQEALANAARYRDAGSAVAVSVVVADDGVRARVTSTGRDEGRRGPGGYGLTGLREQVTAMGGSMRTGPVGADWVVECVLPAGATAVRSGSPR